jgi:hypothetical protein
MILDIFRKFSEIIFDLLGTNFCAQDLLVTQINGIRGSRSGSSAPQDPESLEPDPVQNGASTDPCQFESLGPLVDTKMWMQTHNKWERNGWFLTSRREASVTLLP